MRTLIVILIAALFAAAPMLSAQDEETPWVKTELSIICWDSELQLSYPGYDDESPIIAPRQMRSQRIAYEGPALFTLSGTPTLDGVAIASPTAIAKVELKPGVSKQLLILIPNSEPSTPYRALVIDDSFGKFPPQSIRFMNFTDNEFSGQLADVQFQIAARQEAIITPASLSAPKYLAPLRLIRKMENDGSWRPVKSTIFQLHTNMRILVLLLQDPQRPFDVKFVLLRDETPKTTEETVEIES
ncbi:hypothetical protein [Cerasicoccus fimbriatus]|uniref:hypothetical protein n=1 Tax=Cerasicoccus fimbriatus TaxID=3014554 RepID=UPI0022B3CBAC|nr:hypothetical protein [Cerasicoccus sp. TK19100]